MLASPSERGVVPPSRAPRAGRRRTRKPQRERLATALATWVATDAMTEVRDADSPARTDASSPRTDMGLVPRRGPTLPPRRHPRHSGSNLCGCGHVTEPDEPGWARRRRTPTVAKGPVELPHPFRGGQCRLLVRATDQRPPGRGKNGQSGAAAGTAVTWNYRLTPSNTLPLNPGK
jgi:hypothetical protein